MKKKTHALIGSAIALAAVVALATPAAAQEYHAWPSKDCGSGGYVYTTARTANGDDTHTITKYGTSTYDQQKFANYTGAVQTHTNYSSYTRSASAQIWTGETGPGYVSFSNPCDR